MDTPEFKPWPSISRLNREVILTEKLDGTSGVIYISDDNKEIAAGSRTRWLTPTDDNFGFCKWVHVHKADLLSLGPGYHYGEWWGQGIQRGYGLTEKRFSLFNVSRWADEPGLIYKGKDADKKPGCCYTVPVLGILTGFHSELIDLALEKLKEQGSVAAPSYPNPEGLIVFHTASQHLYKYTLNGDGHKTSKKM